MVQVLNRYVVLEAGVGSDGDEERWNILVGDTDGSARGHTRLGERKGETMDGR